MTGPVPDLELLRRHDASAPHSSTYPPIAHFRAFSPADHRRAVQRANAATPDAPLALYVHAPFCPQPCFHCDRVRIIAHDAELIVRYLHALLREIELQGALFDHRRPVERLHWGGGSPSYLTDEQLRTVLEQIDRSFGFGPAPRREFSIELDPRGIDEARLARLVAMGFNRISLGLQEYESDVQSAVNRRQPPESTESLVRAARALGIRTIGLDLVYGLPRQTPEGFAATLDRVIAAQPDRISIDGYRHRPDRYKTQRHLDAAQLPDPGARLKLLHVAICKLLAVGYIHIGMHRFARHDDELVQALEQGCLRRNFDCYSPRVGLSLVGLGMSGVSRLGGAFSQNAISLGRYEDAIASDELATGRGIVLSQEDHLRAAVIDRILCGREVRYGVLGARFSRDVRRHFRAALARLAAAERDGLVQRFPDRLIITPLGRYFLAALAMPFDAYASGTGDGDGAAPDA